MGDEADYPGRVLKAKKGKDDPAVYISAVDGKQVDEAEFEAACREVMDYYAEAKVDETQSATEGDSLETYDGVNMYVKLQAGRRGLFRNDGEQLTEYKYLEIHEEGCGKYSHHYLQDHLLVKTEEAGDKFGVLDEDGREIAPCGSFTAVEEVCDGLLAVQIHDGGLFALAREEGGSLRVVSDYIYNTEHQK